MKKTIITLLATAALAAPALAANDAATQPQQQPQAQQSQDTQQQSQAQPQNGRQQNENQASNQQQPAQNLSRSEVKQMQSALNQQGFKAGRPDGKLGPETRHAVQAFNQKKGIQSQNGQPTEQTLAQLGINGNQDQNARQPQQNGNGSEQQPSQNGQ
jgi:peptidoglycan hydrolase-like protein with peptidoglycan-binding domain